jgi:hypothetical protein
MGTLFYVLVGTCHNSDTLLNETYVRSRKNNSDTWREHRFLPMAANERMSWESQRWPGGEQDDWAGLE